MLVFNCSKAAVEFFTATKKGVKHSPIEPAPHKTIAESIKAPLHPDDEPDEFKQWHWFVHAIKVKRKNVLIVMDYHSRFAITLTGLKKGDEYAFLNRLEHHLNVHVHELMSLVADDSDDIENSLENYFHQHNSCAFHQRGDRSVQAHINDVAWHFNFEADKYGEVPTAEELITFDSFANQLLRKRKGENDYFEPHHAFLQHWLSAYGERTKQQAAQHIADLQAEYRAMHQAKRQLTQGITENNTSSQNRQEIMDTGNVISIDSFRRK